MILQILFGSDLTMSHTHAKVSPVATTNNPTAKGSVAKGQSLRFPPPSSDWPAQPLPTNEGNHVNSPH
jgi:hypothetical protein